MSVTQRAEQAAPEAEQTAPVAGHPLSDYGVLLVGILAVSTSSILIRLADAPPLVVGAWRMVLATLVLTPLVWSRARRELPRLDRREVGALVLSGVALAIHFASWIYSLSLTTVASSVILVSTNPIFVGLAAHFLLGERVDRRTVAAIAVTMLGSVIVSFGDLALSGQALLGDLLALVGAIAGSAYILLGRTVRRRVSTGSYVWPCYGLAGLILLAIGLLTHQPLVGYAPRTYGVFVLLAVVPQILGHSSFNWALGHFSPILVTVALLGEPIGATLLAFLILGETPPTLTLVGAPLIMAGILLASWAEARLGAAAPGAVEIAGAE